MYVVSNDNCGVRCFPPVNIYIPGSGRSTASQQYLHVGRFCQAERCGTQARGDGEAIAAATLHYAACGHHPASPSQRSRRRGWSCLGGDASIY